jgi:hypothetical protein
MTTLNRYYEIYILYIYTYTQYICMFVFIIICRISFYLSQYFRSCWGKKINLFHLKFSFCHPSDSAACGGRAAHRILATPLKAVGGIMFLPTSEQAYYPMRYNTEDWHLWLTVCHPKIPYFVRRWAILFCNTKSLLKTPYQHNLTKIKAPYFL